MRQESQGTHLVGPRALHEPPGLDGQRRQRRREHVARHAW